MISFHESLRFRVSMSLLLRQYKVTHTIAGNGEKVSQVWIVRSCHVLGPLGVEGPSVWRGEVDAI